MARQFRVALAQQFLLLALGDMAAFLAQPVAAGSVFFSLDGPLYHLNVGSIKERRFGTVMQQQYDYSCGSAAVTTLLRFHYGYDVDLETVFSSMYEHGDQEQINQLGFSMLDMKNYLASIGFNADGVQIPLARYLDIAGVPAIVMIETDGYKHFVVLKGVRDGMVLLGDPALGLKTLSVEAFEEVWSGLFFLITNEASKGRQSFNRDRDWSLVARAPIGNAHERMNLGDFTLSLPIRGDYF